MRSRGTSRLELTVTLGMVAGGWQLVRLREVKLSPGGPQLPHPEVPGQGLPAEVLSQLLRLLKPTTQERQAIAGPRAWEWEGGRRERREPWRVAGGWLWSQAGQAGD